MDKECGAMVSTPSNHRKLAKTSGSLMATGRDAVALCCNEVGRMTKVHQVQAWKL
jgi:hypothetical protein